ncbi:cytochrome P450 [Polymorphobacter glacialis]|uniref:Cytochrome P450 n=1 Tax=Sandarakinorhabdus glacialis TaxID=1614636 RepID=A0A916ZPP1_9SPHN|nr:cytochrome P450 [Polymorphobacter glacialis]GGE08041.1 cytochrome P450 [Polymorphobacter glacialis]
MNAHAKISALIPADLPEPSFEDLAHLPGMQPARVPIMRTINFLKDPLGRSMKLTEQYGRVVRRQDFGGWGVSLIGPEANELVMFNKDKIFSSSLGWNPVLENLFPNGLMLLDFEEHRIHRKTLSIAFKTEPMKHYLGELNTGIVRGLAKWPTTQFKFYPAIKSLTLDLAAASFLGVPWGPDGDKINQAFVDMVLASVSVIRKPLPLTQMRRGIKGRAFMSDFFGREIPKRRGKTGDDIFTQICNATTEDGGLLTDQEIIDHMNFLMMAAHDTTTSSITSTVHFLGTHPEWQDRIREEIMAVKAKTGGELTYETLGDLETIELVFKEAIRLIPPVPSMPRRALREFTFMNHVIPAGTHVGINPMVTHRLPDVWPQPEKFDPTRFTAENSKGRHKYAWVPFGGGGHMCLGLHFAYMQVKSFFFHLLAENRIVLAPEYKGEFYMFPIPKPKDGLPLTIEKL